MIFIGHFLPECILLRLVVNLQPLVRQRANQDTVIIHIERFYCSTYSVHYEIMNADNRVQILHNSMTYHPFLDTETQLVL